ncbi:hypothetical protein [Pannonibacter phragmitetus]|uniref:hypothetical protein n=1 Tax=Pannonibacter phragmitetus TaxID=121719 RepID=UPI003D2EF95F
MRLLITAIATLLGSSAMACEPPVITIDEKGNARWSDVGPETRGAMENYAGPASSAQDVLVIDERASKAQWIGPGHTPDEIAVVYGINSYVYTGSERCAPPGMPRSLDDIPDDPPPEDLTPGKPIPDLFPGEPAAGIQPRSGLWQARLGTPHFEGCPQMMQQYGPMGTGLKPEMLAPRPLTYKVPFHPGQLEMTKRLAAEGLSTITWRRAGPDSGKRKCFPNFPRRRRLTASDFGRCSGN